MKSYSFIFYNFYFYFFDFKKIHRVSVHQLFIRRTVCLFTNFLSNAPCVCSPAFYQTHRVSVHQLFI